MGVGYIIGPKIAGVLVAGGVLAGLFLFHCGIIDYPDLIAAQLAKLGYLTDITKPGGPGGWDPATHNFVIGPRLFIVLIYDRLVQVLLQQVVLLH